MNINCFAALHQQLDKAKNRTGQLFEVFLLLRIFQVPFRFWLILAACELAIVPAVARLGFGASYLSPGRCGCRRHFPAGAGSAFLSPNATRESGWAELTLSRTGPRPAASMMCAMRPDRGMPSKRSNTCRTSSPPPPNRPISNSSKHKPRPSNQRVACRMTTDERMVRLNARHEQIVRPIAGTASRRTTRLPCSNSNRTPKARSQTLAGNWNRQAIHAQKPNMPPAWSNFRLNGKPDSVRFTTKSNLAKTLAGALFSRLVGLCLGELDAT